jgi:osmotically inducible protein OsmC
MTARNGSAEWHGSVKSGSGTITVGDRAFEGAYSYESRFGEAAGTNPEQLLAAAHSGCFTMALANGLSAAGHRPESLRTNARVQLRKLDGAITLARIDLETEGDVPGIDEPQFRAYAEAAKADCPVSRALTGIPEITLTAKLLTADTPRSAPVVAVAPRPLAGRRHQASTREDRNHDQAQHRDQPPGRGGVRLPRSS